MAPLVMRADDYVRLFHEVRVKPITLGEIYDDTPDDRKNTPADIKDIEIYLAHHMLRSAIDLAKSRGGSVGALQGSLREHADKWRAVCRRLAPEGWGIREMAFLGLVRLCSEKAQRDVDERRRRELLMQALLGDAYHLLLDLRADTENMNIWEDEEE